MVTNGKNEKNEKRARRRKRALLNWIFLAVLLAVVAAISVKSYVNVQKQTKWKLQEYQAVESTYTGDLELSILASATLQPYEVVQVRPEASGRIEEFYIGVGDWVTEGDPIALLDQEDLLNGLDSARAGLSNAQAQLDLTRLGYTPRELQSYTSAIESAQLALDQATEDLTRVQRLHDAGFASDEELDNATYAVEKTQQVLDQARKALDVLLQGSTDEEIRMAQANVESSRIAVREAQRALGNATIFSPMTGIILERFVTEGSVVVSTLASFAGGDAMCSIGDVSKMKAFASVDESDIGSVKVGQKCTFDVDAYPDETFEGTVLKIHPQASAQSGATSFTAEIEVPNPDHRLMSGMTCEVEIITDTIKNILLVPDRAIAQKDERTFVFVVDVNDKIEAREITIGKTNYEFTEVLSGLKDGEKVIVRGVPSDLLNEIVKTKGGESDESGVQVKVE